MTLGGLTRQRRWILGKCKARRERATKGKARRNARRRKTTVKRKGNARTDDSCFAGGCGVLWQVGTQESPVPEAEEGPRKQTSSCNIQAVSGASCGRNARILVDSGADEHLCPTNFASTTPLRLAKGGMRYGAQGHRIEAHGTRTVCMRLGPEGQSVGAEFRVTNVRKPILSTGK